MLFWLLVVGVLCLALGFVLGATFRQYRPIRKINQTFHVQGADSVRAAVGTRSPVGHQYPFNGDRRNWMP